MSLTNKATLFDLLNGISSPNHQDAIQTMQLANFLTEEQKVLKYNPFILTDTQRNYLAAMGIQSAPSAAQMHDHPIHKVMESYLWLTKLARQLTKKTTVSFTKHAKFLELQKENKNVIKLENPCLDLKDQIRYDTAKTSPIPKCTTPYLVMHDSGHYYSPTQIAKIFRDNPKMEMIFLTLIVPVETVIQHDSFYPELYELRYSRDTVIYIPEGHSAGAYEQPLSAKWWLNTNKIQDGSLTLGVKRLESYKAHHLFMVTRKPAQVYEKFAVYDTPDLTILPAIFPDAPIRQRLIPYKMMIKIHDYAKAVKTNSTLNLEAKLRHLLVDVARAPEDSLFLLVHFIYTTINLRRQFVLEDCIEESSIFYRYLRRCKETFLTNLEKDKLERYLATVRIQKFHFTFTLVTQLGSTSPGPLTITPDPAVPETFTFTQTMIPDGKTTKSSQTVTQDLEEDDEDIFQEAYEDPVEEVSVDRIGNDCGLVALAAVNQLSYAEVNVAYEATKEEILPQIPSTQPNFENFRATTGFPWLSGQELVYISAKLGKTLAIHTDLYCRIPEHPETHVYHSNGNHWEARTSSSPCSCQKQT